MAQLMIVNPDSGHDAPHAGHEDPTMLESLRDRMGEVAGVPTYIDNGRSHHDFPACRECRNLSLLASHRLAVAEGRTTAAEWCLQRLAVPTPPEATQ
jgi:hypothetical protein